MIIGYSLEKELRISVASDGISGSKKKGLCALWERRLSYELHPLLLPRDRGRVKVEENHASHVL